MQELLTLNQKKYLLETLKEDRDRKNNTLRWNIKERSNGNPQRKYENERRYV